MRKPRRTTSDSGFTFFEVMLASFLGILLMLVLLSTVDSLGRAHGQIRAHDRAAALTHQVLTEMRTVCIASRRLYNDDAEGQGFWNALTLDGVPALAGSRLPMVTSTGRLEPDADGEAFTGNALLFVTEDARRIIETSTLRTYRMAQVRFVAFYLTASDEQVVQARDDRLDLARFTSEVFVDRFSLDSIPFPDDRAEVVMMLRDEGVEFAWDSAGTADQAFFRLEADGSIAATPEANAVIGPDPDRPFRLFLRNHPMTVAGNGPSPEVPRFARPVQGVDTFPSGLEVKVVGPAGGRKVMARLSVIAGTDRGWDVVADQLRIWTVRDL